MSLKQNPESCFMRIWGYFFIFLVKLCTPSMNLLDKRKLLILMAWKTVLHLAWYLLLTPETTSALRKEMSSVNSLRKCYLFLYHFLFTSKGQKFTLFCKMSTIFLSGVFESMDHLHQKHSDEMLSCRILGPSSHQFIQNRLAGGSQYSPSPFSKQAR